MVCYKIGLLPSLCPFKRISLRKKKNLAISLIVNITIDILQVELGLFGRMLIALIVKVLFGLIAVSASN